MCHKKKTYKNFLEASQLDNETKYLEKKNKINIVLKKKNLKIFIRNNKSILKTQQRVISERHNVFTEEINKIALIEIYAYRTSKDLVKEKEGIKCNIIIKHYRK